MYFLIVYLLPELTPAPVEPPDRLLPDEDDPIPEELPLLGVLIEPLPEGDDERSNPPEGLLIPLFILVAPLFPRVFVLGVVVLEG